jgi:prolyl-tRNA synthetase
VLSVLRLGGLSIDHVSAARKYRDEPRPRQGLLRGREFVMKDLYTFDYSNQNATKLYDTVKSTYMQLFEELKLPFLVAEASSGDMGGKLSHEFLLPSPQGEDTIIRCSNCDLTYNDEVADGKARGQEFAIARPAPGFATEGMHAGTAPTISNALWIGVSKDRRTLVRGWYPKYVMNMTDKEPLAKEASSHAIKAIARAAGIDLDLSVDNPLQLWANQASSDRAFLLTRGNMPKVLDLYDSQVRAFQRPPLGDLAEKAGCAEDGIQYSMLDRYPGTADGLRLAKAQDGEQCPKCAQWSLTARSAIELGHTFHLGTRYTKPLRSVVTVPDPEGDAFQPGEKSKLTHMHMGCHGIGVSRMISAVADVLADKRGLNWPRVIAPYEVVVIAMEESQAPEAEKVYDLLASDQPSLDVILEDRDRRAPWLLTDADLIGFPVIVVVGRAWKKRQAVEVQCRRLNVKEEVPLDQLAGFVQSQLAKL